MISNIHKNLNNKTPTKMKNIRMVQENKNIPQTKIGKSFKRKITQNNKIWKKNLKKNCCHKHAKLQKDQKRKQKCIVVVQCIKLQKLLKKKVEETLQGIHQNTKSFKQEDWYKNIVVTQHREQ
jgi:hypothetical protein